jgi:uncharacterized protein (TIGR03435 family)
MGKCGKVNILAMICICVLIASLMHAQNQNREKPSFDVISIKRGIQDNRTGHDLLPGGRFHAHAPLQSLISYAYEIDYLQVIGVPKSLENIKWDIEARPEEGKYPLIKGILDRHLGNLMVQSMLEDRFKLKVHQETRIWPGYEMVIEKSGPRIKLSPDQTKEGCGGVSPDYLEQHSMPLSNLAATLSRILKLFEGEEKRFHVVDKTGLKGFYDIQLRWSPNKRWALNASAKQSTEDSEVTIFDAIKDQLGLKLVPADIPAPVVVVNEVQMPVTN